MPLNAVATDGAKIAPFLAIGERWLSNIPQKFQKSVRLEALRSDDSVHCACSLTVDGCLFRVKTVKCKLIFGSTNDSDSGKGCEIQEKHGMAVQLRPNAPTLQNRTVYWSNRKKNIQGKRRGISATISRSCRRCRLPEAAL